MPDYNVSNASELSIALGTATGGDTIICAPGNYGNVTTSKAAGSTLTIRAAALDTVYFNLLNVTNAEYLRFENINIVYPAQASWIIWSSTPIVVTVNGSDNIYFYNCEIAGERQNDVQALVTQSSAVGCSNLTIDHCHVHHAIRRGIYMLGANTNITITNSWIHNVHESLLGIADGGSVSGTYEISNCLITDNFIDTGSEGFGSISFPTDAHGSIIAVRTSTNTIIERNIFRRAGRLGIQFYGDVGATYGGGSIRYNLFYDASMWTLYLLYAPNSSNPTWSGTTYIQYNTWISGNQDETYAPPGDTDNYNRFYYNSRHQTVTNIPNGDFDDNLVIANMVAAGANNVYYYTTNSSLVAGGTNNIKFESNGGSVGTIDDDLWVAGTFGYSRDHGQDYTFEAQPDTFLLTAAQDGGSVGHIRAGSNLGPDWLEAAPPPLSISGLTINLASA